MEPCRRRAIWAEQVRVTNIGVQCETQDETRQDADAETDALPDVKHACPKCGKEVRRGMFFHKKYCRGK